MNEMVKLNKKWKKDHEKKGYTFMSRKNIYKLVVKILKSKFLIYLKIYFLYFHSIFLCFRNFLTTK